MYSLFFISLVWVTRGSQGEPGEARTPYFEAFLASPGIPWVALGPLASTCFYERLYYSPKAAKKTGATRRSQEEPGAPPGSSWLLLATPDSSWLLLALPGSSWLSWLPPGSSWLQNSKGSLEKTARTNGGTLLSPPTHTHTRRSGLWHDRQLGLPGRPGKSQKEGQEDHERGERTRGTYQGHPRTPEGFQQSPPF